MPNAVPCDALLSSTYDTSDDGKVIVGLAWNGCNFARAFRWEESTGMVDLGSTVAGQSSRANGVSGDGRVVVGWQETATGPRHGARWVDGKQELFRGPSGIIGEAHAANRDGSIIVGQACEFASLANLFANQQAWIWTARDGVQCLQPPRIRPANNFIGIALATSEDGHIIGGSQSFGLEAESVIWIDREPMYLKDYLRANGVPDAFEGWVNTGFVTGVSRDGRMLVGYGAGPQRLPGIHRDSSRRRTMMIRRVPFGMLALFLVSITSVSASAQSCELSGLAGFTPAVELEHRAPELTDLSVRGGFTFGFQGTRFFTPRWGAEVVFTQQASALEAGTPGGTADLYRDHAGAASGERRVSIRRRRRAAAAVCVWRRRRDVLRRARSRIGRQGGVRIRWRHQVFSVAIGRLARTVPLQADPAQRRS